jgi:hypothetical protein
MDECILDICNKTFEKAQVVYEEQPNDFNFGVMFGIDMLRRKIEHAC